VSPSVEQILAEGFTLTFPIPFFFPKGEEEGKREGKDND